MALELPGRLLGFFAGLAFAVAVAVAGGGVDGGCVSVFRFGLGSLEAVGGRMRKKRQGKKIFFIFLLFFSTVEREETGSLGGRAREGPGLDKAVPGGT